MVLKGKGREKDEREGMQEKEMENGCAKGGREMKERDGEETRENNLILNKCICAMCLFGL